MKFGEVWQLYIVVGWGVFVPSLNDVLCSLGVFSSRNGVFCSVEGSFRVLKFSMSFSDCKIPLVKSESDV